MIRTYKGYIKFLKILFKTIFTLLFETSLTFKCPLNICLSVLQLDSCFVFSCQSCMLQAFNLCMYLIKEIYIQLLCVCWSFVYELECSAHKSHKQSRILWNWNYSHLWNALCRRRYMNSYPL